MKIVIPIVFYCKGGVERVISVLLHNRRWFGDSGRLRYSGNNLFVLALIGGYHIFMVGGANFGIRTDLKVGSGKWEVLALFFS